MLRRLSSSTARSRYRECFQTEEVELHKAGLLHPFHVELGRRNIRLRVAIERHEFAQRPVGDHDAGGVRRGVAVKPFELQRDTKGALDHLLGIARRLQARLTRNGRCERHRLCRILRHHLAQLVDLPVGHFQHAADVAQHAARLQGAEGDDLRDLIAAVLLSARS